MNCNYILINSMIALFSTIILKEYLDLFLCEKKNKKKWFVNTFYIVYIVFQIYHDVTESMPPLVILIFSMISAFFICVTAYEDCLKRKVIIVLLLHVMWMLDELLVGYAFMAFGVTYKNVALVGSVVSKIIMFTSAKIIKSYRKPKIAKELTIGYWIILLFVPISSIYLVHNIFKISHEHKEDLVFSFVSSILIIMVNYIIFKVYEKLEEEFELQKQNQLFHQQLEACSKELAERECYIQETRKIKHDIKNHLIFLKNMVEQDQKDQTIKYIENLINREVIIREEIIKSGNIMIDSLINYKNEIAVKQEIIFEVEIFVPNQLPYDNRDICVILGNSLDNAIEAASKVKEQSFIKVIIKYSKGTLSIIMKNSYNGLVKKNCKGTLLSTKEDAKNHGIGLLSIRSMVEKYNGEVMIEMDSKVFVLKILLYDKGKVTF